MIEARRDEIVRRWLGRVRAGGRYDGLDDAQVIDSLGEFFEAVARFVASGGSEEVRGRLKAIAREHGSQRRRLDVPLDLVVDEYVVAREILLDVAGEDRWSPTIPELQPAMSAFVTGVAESVSQYTQHREAQLRREVEYLDLGDAFFALDREWRVVRVNRNQERLSRMTREQTLGRVFWELWPEAALPSSPYWREYHLAMEERVARSFVAYYAPLDLWTSSTVYPTEDGGIAVFFRDDSAHMRAERDLKRREETLRRIFEMVPDPIVLAGFDGRFQRVNPAFERMIGVTEAVATSVPLFDFIHPEDRDAAAAELERLAHGHVTEAFEIRLLHADGHHRRVSWRAATLQARETVVAVGRDVTEERDRAAFEKQLIGIVSHDLRSPLNAIVLAATTALRRAESLDERTLKALGLIQSSAERAVRMIRDLLDFTRARLGGGIPVEPQPCDLHEIVREAVDEVLACHPERRVEVEGSGPAEGRWDPARLAQAVANLVTNALRHGDPRHPVRVVTRGGRSGVSLEVHNRGPPIPPDVLPFVFEPLRRGSSGSGGLGLGLYIVERIVRAHCGTVAVTSSADEGTRVVVSLPRDPGPGCG